MRKDLQTSVKENPDASPEHLSYLKKLRHHRYLITLLRVLILLFFLIFWEIGSRTGWVDTFIFSSPYELLQTAIELITEGEFFRHIGITLGETCISFIISTLLGIAIAILLWWFSSLHEITEPYWIALNSLPKSALAPILIVWFGNTVRSILITSISLTIVVTILTVLQGFQSISPNKIRLIYSLGGSKRQVLQKILLPSSVPIIMNVLKVNIGLCLIGVIIGEFLAARAGLGYLIIYGSQIFKMNWVILSIVLLMLISLLLYKFLQFLEDRIAAHYR